MKKKKARFNEEIASIERYLELAKALPRMAVDKAKLASLSSQILSDETGSPPVPVKDVADQLRKILLIRKQIRGIEPDRPLTQTVQNEYLTREKVT